MLNQLVGGDVVSACQSANLRWDIVSASTIEEGYKIPRISECQRSIQKNDSNHSGGCRKGGKD